MGKYNKAVNTFLEMGLSPQEVQASVTITFSGKRVITTVGNLDKPFLFLPAIVALAEAAEDYFTFPSHQSSQVGEPSVTIALLLDEVGSKVIKTTGAVNDLPLLLAAIEALVQKLQKRFGVIQLNRVRHSGPRVRQSGSAFYTEMSAKKRERMTSGGE